MSPTVARLTSDWTERHSAVAGAVVVAAAAGAAAGAQVAPFSWVAGAAVVMTVLVALRLDAFGGIVAGLAGAAVVVGAKQLAGEWTAEVFAASLAITVALLALGWVTGLTAARLRVRAPRDLAVGGMAAPAQGSLGLLTGDLAMARLDEEMARATRHRRPLMLVVLRTEVVDESLGPAARQAAFRTVARLVETLLRETDVPFALAVDEVGAILPETDAEAAWQLVGPLVEAVTGATFTVREHAERRSFADSAELHVGLAAMEAGGDATALLAAARRTGDDDGAAAHPGARGISGWHGRQGSDG